jgi:hypothetical protein
MARMATILQTVSTVAAFVSAMCLFYASIGVPHEERSWEGRTPKELAWKRRQAILKWLGIPAAIVAFGCQLWIIYFLPENYRDLF